MESLNPVRFYRSPTMPAPVPSGRRSAPSRPTEIPRPGHATYEAPPNIALVKYWGMRDPDLVLPLNSSLSMTLRRLRTRTSVRFDPRLPADRFRLNGRWTQGGPLAAVSRFLDLVREHAGVACPADVRSTNNFPTASGLASSASGFAALAGATTHALGLSLSPRDLSRLARRGSGSAARSIFGGFVLWHAGTRPDGRDSYARSVLGPDHWPALRDLVILIRDAPQKPIRSSEAMQATVRTSPAYADRLHEVPQRLSRLERALRRRESEAFLDLLMEECDDFRHVCETTTPPLDYLTPASRAVIRRVRELNREAGRTIAGYTHDAGAHLHVFALARDLRRIRGSLARGPGVRGVLTVGPGPGGRLVRAPGTR
jgi:diphosphomevalonate decarboxylase